MTNDNDVTPTPQRTLTRTGSVCVTGRMEIEKALIIDRLAAAEGMTRSQYVRYQLNLIIEANTTEQAKPTRNDYEAARADLHSLRQQIAEGTQQV